MISAQQNEHISRIGPGTVAGKVVRSYWQPALLTEELDGERPVKAIKLMCEELVVFRDEEGKYGVIGRHCAHRGADMCYGRVENGGIRCPFHGWLFDTNGNCLEQPAEPEGSLFHTKVKQRSYPCKERNGIIFAYLGVGEPPAFPGLDCFLAPAEYCFSFKGLWECNWLQALEVGIDPAHASFLHRFFEDDDPKDSYGKQFRDNAADTDIPVTKVLREFPRPAIDIESTDYGFRLISRRDIGNTSMHVRVTNHLFPNAIIIPMSNDMVIAQWHVPIDDKNCFWYSMFVSFGAPINKELMREQRLIVNTLPEYAPKYNKRNNYGFDAQEQKTKTFTGMGMDINIHDQWACESMGPIQDRTQEHLGKSDVGIIHYRKMLRNAIKLVEENKTLVLMQDFEETLKLRGPVAIDEICPSDQWQKLWKERDLKRREACAWAPTNPWSND